MFFCFFLRLRCCFGCLWGGLRSCLRGRLWSCFWSCFRSCFRCCLRRSSFGGGSGLRGSFGGNLFRRSGIPKKSIGCTKKNPTFGLWPLLSRTFPLPSKYLIKFSARKNSSNHLSTLRLACLSFLCLPSGGKSSHQHRPQTL